MELDRKQWVKGVLRFGNLFFRIAGRAERLTAAARKAGQKWFQRMRPGVPIYLQKAA